MWQPQLLTAVAELSVERGHGCACPVRRVEEIRVETDPRIERILAIETLELFEGYVSSSSELGWLARSDANGIEHIADVALLSLGFRLDWSGHGDADRIGRARRRR